MTATHPTRPHKRFLYLVQSAGDLPPVYSSIESDDADLLRLTFKVETPGTIFYPKSTWTEGRNRLLEEALARAGDYLYYIFLDEDIAFLEGDWRSFERALLKYEPAVAVPYYPDYGPTTKGSLLHEEAQTVHWFDAMYNAFHRDVVRQGLVLPYHPEFDKRSWWYSQWFVIELSRLLHPGEVLQMHETWIGNLQHSVYPQESDWLDLREWFEREVIDLSQRQSLPRRAARRVVRPLRRMLLALERQWPAAGRGIRAVGHFVRPPHPFTGAVPASGPKDHRAAEERYATVLRWNGPYWTRRRELLARRSSHASS